MSSGRPRVIVHWLPPIVWAACVLSFSSDALSAAHTGVWLARVVAEVIGHPLPPREFNLLHFLLRKAAHLTEYGILGALLFRALRAGAPGWRWGWAAAAVVLAGCVAAADEWHQFFIPYRTGSPWDVLLDVTGAALAQFLARLRVNLFRS